MVGQKKKSNVSLGKSVIKNRFSKQTTANSSSKHTTDLHRTADWCRLPVRSVTEENNLTEFFTLADLAGAEFEAERRNVTFASSDQAAGVLSAAEKKHIDQIQEQNKSLLKIPRRPHWTREMNAEELDRLEKDAFLQWRRQLAQLESMDHIVLTPYEKNLEFWRQLWRVIERSDIVMQIVDARNPLLFRCQDMEEYINEVNPGKISIVLVNKSDLLTDKQREFWATYFTSIGVRAIFWSAKLADAEVQAAIDKEDDTTSTIPEEDEEDDSDEEENSNEEVSEHNEGDRLNRISSECSSEIPPLSPPHVMQREMADSGLPTSSCNQSSISPVGPTSLPSLPATPLTTPNSPHMLSVDELIHLMKTVHVGEKSKTGMTTVGLVGYPNVGKSSSLNAIFRTKKAGVSATPGRTKHYQTLQIDDELMLCDCPGLVMPSLVYSRAHLIVSGILPIDNMRDCVPPVTILCDQFHRSYLETLYGVNIPRPKEGEDPTRSPTAREFLSAHAYMHGLMTTKGCPNIDRAARQILKDYVNGRLLYRHPPPGVSAEEFAAVGELTEEKVKRLAIVLRKKADRDLKEATDGVLSDFDKVYFDRREAGFGFRGKKPLPGQSLRVDADKFVKKHHKQKKEKLRRIHSNLDKHE